MVRDSMEGTAWRRWLLLRVLGVVVDPGHKQAFFLTVQDLIWTLSVCPALYWLLNLKDTAWEKALT